MSDSAALRRLERQIRRRLDARVALRRVWDSLPAIVQIVAAVAAAYAIAHWGLGHPVPVMAVTVSITSLGLTRDARPRRILEAVTGVVVGVALSEALATVFGKGLWQLAVVLLVVLIVGRAVSSNPAFAIAAAVPSAIVVVLPATEGGDFGRTLDALVGGVVALLVTALIPRNPRATATRDRRALLSTIDQGLGSVVDSLADADPAAGELGLSRLRATQPLIEAWTASLDTAIAVSRISPFLRARLPELHRDLRVLTAAELAARHLRSVARRVEFLVRDGVPRPALAELVAQFATAIRLLGDELDDPQVAGASRSLMTDVAHRLDPATVIPEARITDSALVLMLRPLAVDILVGSGMPIDEARGMLPPV